MANQSKFERGLFFVMLIVVAISVIGHFLYPLSPHAVKHLITHFGLNAHLGSNRFVDGREWLGIPNAADVVSNLPFAIFGVYGLWLQSRLHKPSQRFSNRESFVLTLFFMGLIFTTVGSSLYHLVPSDSTLLWDRVGMTVAFSGVLGMAASERVSARSGIWLSLASLLVGACALMVWSQTRDVLPWSAFQFGGMSLVLVLACIKPTPYALGVRLVWVSVFYAVAKVFEATDAAIFEATGQWVSGHTLKHLIASLAAVPVIVAQSNPIALAVNRHAWHMPR